MCLTWKHTLWYIHMLLWRLLANRQLCLEYTKNIWRHCVFLHIDDDLPTLPRHFTCVMRSFWQGIPRLLWLLTKCYLSSNALLSNRYAPFFTCIQFISNTCCWWKFTQIELMWNPNISICDHFGHFFEIGWMSLTWNQVAVVCFEVGQPKMTGRFCSRNGNDVFSSSQH